MILKIISEGYRIPFYKKPPLVMPSTMKNIQTPCSPDMRRHIQEMKNTGVLEGVQPSPSFISNMFLVLKDDGSYRPIFNLKKLNKFVCLSKFRLINHTSVQAFLQPKDWMVKIDMSNAYFHLPVAASHRPFLRLIFGHELLQMTCLPFGLASAPRIFAMITNWVAQILRDRGFRVLVYLDDFLLANQNKQVSISQVSITIQILESLGWQINFKKSVLTPQTSLQYLGIIWDTFSNRKSLPLTKQLAVKQKLIRVLNHEKSTLKELQSLIGSLNFASIVVPHGRLRFRRLLAHSNSLLDKNPLHHFTIPMTTRRDLTWWLSHCHRNSELHIAPVSHFLSTDASGSGWGAQLDNQALSGFWCQNEQSLHSNEKEMLAVLKVLQSQCQLLKNCTISIQSDNKTVLSYLRNEGGTKSKKLMKLTYKVFHLLQRYNIRLSLHHLPGRYNVEADRLSRGSRHPEWHLLPALTERVFSKWGVPIIDLFASRDAHVVPRYVSLDATDPKAEFVDAFSQQWHYSLAWVFPPPYLMPKVLSHLNKATGVYLIVAPRWEKVFWRPDLKKRSIAPPFTIHNLAEVLVDVITNLSPQKVQDLTLEIWRCGGGMKH